MSISERTIQKEHLLGKTLQDLKLIAANLELPAFVASQIAYWLYKTNIQSYDEMTNISKKVRLLLAEHYDLGVIESVKVQQSSDGTKKYLFTVSSHKFI
jgi:23S rRNA (adenine2503-C2)-methyltransferase